MSRRRPTARTALAKLDAARATPGAWRRVKSQGVPAAHALSSVVTRGTTWEAEGEQARSVSPLSRHCSMAGMHGAWKAALVARYACSSAGAEIAAATPLPGDAAAAMSAHQRRPSQAMSLPFHWSAAVQGFLHLPKFRQTCEAAGPPLSGAGGWATGRRTARLEAAAPPPCSGRAGHCQGACDPWTRCSGLGIGRPRRRASRQQPPAHLTSCTPRLPARTPEPRLSDAWPSLLGPTVPTGGPRPRGCTPEPTGWRACHWADAVRWMDCRHCGRAGPPPPLPHPCWSAAHRTSVAWS